jgi:hypothetical protein
MKVVFASIADFVSSEFTMDSPQRGEASQARDKAGLQPTEGGSARDLFDEARALEAAGLAG